MAVSALDSRVFRNLFGTQDIRDIFTDTAYVRQLIETEAALARAQSRVGVIPERAGAIITEAFTRIQIEYVVITIFCILKPPHHMEHGSWLWL
jgi:hypothetical protein